VRLLKAVVPILISSSVFQVQVLLSNNIAGKFGEGYITLLTNTNQVMGMFQSLIVVNMINMIYPKFVRDIKKNLQSGLSKMTNYISITNYLVIALIWTFFFAGENLIQLMFVRGRFTPSNAHTVYVFSIALAIALPVSVIRDYCYRFYYSIGNTRKPMSNSISTVTANVALLIIGYLLNLPLSIVLAPTIGSFFSCFNIILRLHRDNINVQVRQILTRLLGANLIGVVAFATSSLLRVTCKNLFIQVCTNGSLIVGIQAVIYFILYLMMKRYKFIDL
jgi:putative peptidoglycan lipid II flippase